MYAIFNRIVVVIMYKWILAHYVLDFLCDPYTAGPIIMTEPVGIFCYNILYETEGGMF